MFFSESFASAYIKEDCSACRSRGLNVGVDAPGLSGRRTLWRFVLARLPCAGMTRYGTLNRNAQTGLKFGSEPDENRRSHSAPFASDHLIDVDPAPDIGLESRFPGVLKRGAIGNRTEVPVALDLAIVVYGHGEPFLFGHAVVHRPDRHVVEVQHLGLQALYRHFSAAVDAQPEFDS